ncbi:unnamed protein product [Caenorhabditis angaria]|uniref:Uncharacterized protein n=1 Tax=Caenorhabditis angaria TaxID=860376 RepID=A0A9P1I4P4_9PELO|nr:unnamed protein product [Caenorhabditis angaria]
MKFFLVFLISSLDFCSASDGSEAVKNLLDGLKETYKDQGIDGVLQYLSSDFKMKGEKNRKITKEYAEKQLKHNSFKSESPQKLPFSIPSLIKYVSSARLEKDMTLVIGTKNGYTLYAKPNPLRSYEKNQIRSYADDKSLLRTPYGSKDDSLNYNDYKATFEARLEMRKIRKVRRLQHYLHGSTNQQQCHSVNKCRPIKNRHSRSTKKKQLEELRYPCESQREMVGAGIEACWSINQRLNKRIVGSQCATFCNNRMYYLYTYEMDSGRLE